MATISVHGMDNTKIYSWSLTYTLQSHLRNFCCYCANAWKLLSRFPFVDFLLAYVILEPYSNSRSQVITSCVLHVIITNCRTTALLAPNNVTLLPNFIKIHPAVLELRQADKRLLSPWSKERIVITWEHFRRVIDNRKARRELNCIKWFRIMS